jgi:uncharacterized protein YfaP (DUF2135 family)
MSRDFTGGYGPEEYLLRNAIKGTYVVRLKLSSPLVPSHGVNVCIKIYTNFGRTTEGETTHIVHMKQPRELVTIATVSL